jgi:cytochrome c
LYLDTQISQRYEHEDDTDSIPEGHAGQVIGDGINLSKKKFTLKNMIAQRMSEQDLVQLSDHSGDTDSIPEGHAGQVIGDGINLNQRNQALLQTEMQDHFNDTEDVPLEQEAT